MIIACTTLEQIKDVMRINNINEGWRKTDLIKHLKKGHLCIRISEGFEYESRRFYELVYPELPIISYEEYIETIIPKTINLRTAIWDTTLIVQCITCKPFEPVEKDGFTLRRNYPTRFEDNRMSIYEEKGVDYYTFQTPQEAQVYLDKLLELVELVNNPVPVVDLNKVGSYKLGHLTSLAVGDAFVSLVKNRKCVAEYSKRQLPLPIIKAQLEQILDHLGVKANIVI